MKSLAPNIAGNNSQETNQNDHIQGLTYAKLCSQKKKAFWRNFQPQLQLQIILKRPEKQCHFQNSTYTEPCSQKRTFWQNLSDNYS